MNLKNAPAILLLDINKNYIENTFIFLQK